VTDGDFEPWFEGRRPTRTEMELGATPERVFDELADGWAYTGWVVGATHIRDVDIEWPAKGSCIHHTLGAWPLRLSDTTEVLESTRPSRLVMRARGWPVGEAVVQLDISTAGAGRARVVLREAPTRGPGRWMDNPALRSVLRARNVETLKRLRDRAENRPEPA
jgi:hypothetical protein